MDGAQAIAGLQEDVTQTGKTEEKADHHLDPGDDRASEFDRSLSAR